jgi:hypothetical protein
MWKFSKPARPVRALVLFLLSLVSLAALASQISPIWTDWYRNGLFKGGLALIKMRKVLESPGDNLTETYLKIPESVQCGPETLEARTADGTCNDLEHPAIGAAGMRFARNVPFSAIPAESDRDVMSPDPRRVSRELLTRPDGNYPRVSFLNLFAASWIQFMVHDWLNHSRLETVDPLDQAGCIEHSGQLSCPHFIPLAEDDPIRKRTGQQTMLVLRTRPDTTQTPEEKAKNWPTTYTNENTAWWDGSQIYGSDLATQKSLRAGHDGLMRVESGRLPMDRALGREATGFSQNWWLGLSLMHHLFVNEHNSIATMLKAKYPAWDDQKLFDKARMINTAVMAKIHTIEWTPSILSNPILRQGMHANWYGFNNHGKSIRNFKPLNNQVLDGIVGGKREFWGSEQFNFTEEFTSVYRLHSLLPDEIPVRDLGTGDPTGKILKTEETRDTHANEVITDNKISNLLYTFGVTHPGALVLNNFPRFLQDLKFDYPQVIQDAFKGLTGQIDMGTIDILRDRERGVPRYNAFRKALHLNPIDRFEDLTDDKAAVAKLKEIYGSVDKLDLQIGLLAESHRPWGYGFGETQFQIFLLMASRRLSTDRFFTDDFNDKVYTPEGIHWVEDATFKSVLTRNYPELAPAMEGMDNAFRPWRDVPNQARALLAAEHPPEDEPAEMAEIAEIEADKLAQLSNAQSTELCGDVTFTPANDLPEQFRQGVFAKPAATAELRFSSHSNRIEAGWRSGGETMGIRLPGQDFVLFTAPAFSAKDTNEYLDSLKHPFWYYFNPFHLRWGEHRNASQLSESVSDPVATTYYSMTPYQLGTGQATRAVKYVVEPVACDAAACFDLKLQLQSTPEETPVEDASKAWSGARVQAARITLAAKPQVCSGRKADYSPWNALPEHRPLGGINRLRQALFNANKEAL